MHYEASTAILIGKGDFLMFIAYECQSVKNKKKTNLTLG